MIVIYNSSCRTWLFGIGIFCIVAGLIIGVIMAPMALFNPILIPVVFLNTYTIIGFILLGTSLILKYFENNWRQKSPDTTYHFNSFRDYVENKRNNEDQPSEE